MAIIIDRVTVISNRKSRKIKDRVFEGYANDVGGFTLFTLDKTRHWFDNSKYHIEEGFSLIDANGNEYHVVSVDYKPKRLKYAIVKTIKVAV